MKIFWEIFGFCYIFKISVKGLKISYSDDLEHVFVILLATVSNIKQIKKSSGVRVCDNEMWAVVLV